MADVTVSDLKSQIVTYSYNPAAIQRAVLDALKTATDGAIEVVDPTNPFVFALESSAVLTAAFMAKNEANTRRQYPAAAQTPEDLYPHMSDRDYVDRFAVPARTVFSMLIGKDELLAKLVLDPATGIKKMVIPRNTFFTVADVVFSLQYPIEIRQLAHGGLQVVYDASLSSPLQELSSNVLSWEWRSGPGGEFLYFEFDVAQFSVVSQTGSLNAATDYRIDVAFQDQYYYTRVYVEDEQGKWQEIRTTHTDQIYDATVPTAVLQVVDQVVTVRIPQIYTSSGLLKRGIRTDVYQTRGKLSMELANYPYTAFQTTWAAFDKADKTVFTAPLSTLQQIIPYSNRVVDGGSDALTFAQLRERVMKNAIGAPTLPITNVQIESTLDRKGYQIVRNVDTITNRVFLATKPMPVPDDERLLTAANSSIKTVTLSTEEASLLESVVDNGSSITITPDTLYRIIDGVVKLVPSVQVAELLALPVDQRAAQVTQGRYLYTPFHYVLDMTDNAFDMRPYYLDAPITETKLFVADNATTLLQVAVKAYGIVRSATGYTLQIAVESGDSWKALADDEVHVQLAYVPQGERDRAYLNGTLAGTTDSGERVFNFDLSSNFNVSKDDGLELTKFLMYSEQPRLTRADLVTDFDVIFSSSSVMPRNWRANACDQVLGRFLLPARIAGVMHEKLRVRFGWALHRLWSRARSVISTIQYKLYEADVPALYDKDVYAVDPVTGSIFAPDGNGGVTATILHHQGDPVLHDDGTPVYKFLKGDVILDGAGQPIVLNSRGMMRQIDVMLIEGAYWFATDAASKAYRSKMVNTILAWVTDDLETMSEQLLEQTRLYFYPKTTLGSIQVMIADGVVTTINAGQSFQVALHVSGAVYSNDKLRSQLIAATVQTISEQLKDSTVSMSAIVSALRQRYGNDVIDVQVTGLGGDTALPALTIMDEGERCSIRKRLVAQADDTLIVQEDITTSFIRHELAQ